VGNYLNCGKRKKVWGELPDSGAKGFRIAEFRD